MRSIKHCSRMNKAATGHHGDSSPAGIFTTNHMRHRVQFRLQQSPEKASTHSEDSRRRSFSPVSAFNVAPPSPQWRWLSLQFPLPVTFPELKSSPAPNSDPTSHPDHAPNPTPVPKPHPLAATKHTPRPKPHRRHHSDSSAFLRSLATPLPMVTLEELHAMQLRLVVHLDEPDNEEEKKAEAHKIPPPVAEKPPLSKWPAHLVTQSFQQLQLRPNPAASKSNQEEVMRKPQYSPSRSHNATKTGFHLEDDADRERSTPRFPG
ncbi:hypothetical protein LDENG_00170330 [Lucifuga dentata]|nr:hypothetical protein LDENG_00170330 [Lucifuga dentata]